MNFRFLPAAILGCAMVAAAGVRAGTDFSSQRAVAALTAPPSKPTFVFTADRADPKLANWDYVGFF